MHCCFSEVGPGGGGGEGGEDPYDGVAKHHDKGYFQAALNLSACKDVGYRE